MLVEFKKNYFRIFYRYLYNFKFHQFKDKTKSSALKHESNKGHKEPKKGLKNNKNDGIGEEVNDGDGRQTITGEIGTSSNQTEILLDGDGTNEKQFKDKTKSSALKHESNKGHKEPKKGLKNNKNDGIGEEVNDGDGRQTITGEIGTSSNQTECLLDGDETNEKQLITGPKKGTSLFF
jgi:hypothetical protein